MEQKLQLSISILAVTINARDTSCKGEGGGAVFLIDTFKGESRESLQIGEPIICRGFSCRFVVRSVLMQLAKMLKGRFSCRNIDRSVYL